MLICMYLTTDKLVSSRVQNKRKEALLIFDLLMVDSASLSCFVDFFEKKVYHFIATIAHLNSPLIPHSLYLYLYLLVYYRLDMVVKIIYKNMSSLSLMT